jgi:hypothetical protein
MKRLHELIAQLLEILVESGDVPVCGEDDERRNYVDLAVYTVLDRPGGKVERVVIEPVYPDEVEQDEGSVLL